MRNPTRSKSTPLANPRASLGVEKTQSKPVIGSLKRNPLKPSCHNAWCSRNRPKSTSNTPKHK